MKRTRKWMVTFFRKRKGGRVTVSPIYAKTPGEATEKAWIELASRNYDVSKLEKEIDMIRVTVHGEKGIAG